MDKRSLIRRVVQVAVVLAIILNVEGYFALSEEKEEVKKAIEVKQEWKEYYCGYTEPSRLVIKTEDQWREVWGKVHRLQLPSPELPRIDFEKEMIIAVFMGEQKSGGYEIEIISVTETQEEIVVEVEEKEPPPESLRTMVLTQPFHIVVIKKSPLPVRFQ